MKGMKKLYQKLNHRIQLLRNIESNQLSEEKWEFYAEIYAEVNPLSETSLKEIDNVSFGQLNLEEYYLITIRFRPDILKTFRVKFKDKQFAINKIINPYEKNKLLKLLCLEV